jgi:peptidoglycan/LPS O-acetylase OafA/YrhL
MRTSVEDHSLGRPAHLPELDGLRGLAVLLVLWAHSYPLVEALASLTGRRIGLAYFGVDVFFVLSGFLITRILLRDREFGSPLRYFWGRRFLRIFPIYYLVLAVVAVFAWGRGIGWCAAYLSNFYFAYHPQPDGYLNHLWSLAVEEHYYIVWPLVVYLFSRRTSMYFAVAVFPMLAIVSAVFLTLNRETMPSADLIYSGTMCRAASLGIGSFFAYVERGVRGSGALLAPISLTTAVLVGVGLLALRRVVPITWMPFVELLCFSMVAGSIVLFVICISGRAFTFSRVLRGTALGHIGLISYGLYLYHYPIYVALGVHSPKGTVAANLIAILAVFCAAFCSYHFIERPILKFKNRFVISLPTSAPAIPPPTAAPLAAVTPPDR